MHSETTLAFYEKKYQTELEAFSLPQAQQRFTATAPEAIDSLRDPQRHLVLILSDQTCVGYFVLHEKDGPAALGFGGDTLLIRSLAVDAAQQRKGFAQQGMCLLPAFARAHFPWAKKLVLVVNEQNTPARALYQKVGFAEHAKRHHALHGTQFVFLRSLGPGCR